MFKEKGQPEGWCGDIGGFNTEKISNEEMDKILSEDPNTKRSVYTQIEWKTTLKDDVKYFFDAVIPQMQNWDCAMRQDDEIRIVFWFDN